MNTLNHLAGLDWNAHGVLLDEMGYAVLPQILSKVTCESLILNYDQPAFFRKRVVMEKNDYGRGEYQYFRYPLPDLVADLRTELYRHLAPIANRWHEWLNIDTRYPGNLSEFTAQCHAAGQQRPTPLLLRYGPGDFNRLHRDLYGEVHFPLQVVFLLNQPGEDFQGGEFVLVEQKPRSQSKATVVPLLQGSAVVFAVAECPRPGARGYRRLKLSHGVSQVHSGNRHTLGIIFHDAT